MAFLRLYIAVFWLSQKKKKRLCLPPKTQSMLASLPSDSESNSFITSTASSIKFSLFLYTHCHKAAIYKYPSDELIQTQVLELYLLITGAGGGEKGMAKTEPCT